MKKLFKGVLASLLVLSLALEFGACRKNEEPTLEPTQETAQETTQETAQETTQTVQKASQETQAPAKASFVGIWKLTFAEDSGMIIDDPTAMGLDMSIEFKEDGSAFATINGKTSKGGKWTETDDGIKLSESKDLTGNDEILKFKYEDGKLIAEQRFGEMTSKMYFEKQ